MCMMVMIRFLLLASFFMKLMRVGFSLCVVDTLRCIYVTENDIGFGFCMTILRGFRVKKNLQIYEKLQLAQSDKKKREKKRNHFVVKTSETTRIFQRAPMDSPKRSWSLSTLPPELIEEILYRAPPESLIRAKPTCKQWYSLITSKRFIYNHLDRSRKRFIRTVGTVQVLDPVTRTRSETPLPKEFQRPYGVRTMVHCDGLLLCTCGYFNYRNTNLAIWNPVLKKITWIKPSTCFTTSDYYGIGYDIKKPRYEYKILRFTDHRYDHNVTYDEDGPEVEVYECKTNSWRTLDTEVDWQVDLSCKGAAVMGNMYWVACNHGEQYILGFDFSVERFKDVCFCPPPAFNNYLACYNGDRLSLLQQDEEEPWDIVVWVTNKLADVDVSFTKYFSVSRPDVPALLDHTDMANPVYFIGKQKRIIAWCEREVFGGDDEIPPTCIIFNEIDEGGVRTHLETERHCRYGYFGTFFCGYVYVPSLVPLPV
ncbi:unnamed protein product [Brassica rapa subsp. narinosa]